MATGNDVIAEAKKYLGKGGSTFWNAYGSGAADWCCMFVWYVMQKCGASKQFLNGGKTAWVPTAQEWFAKNGTKVALKDAKAGDIVIITWDGGSRDHIGFAIKPLSASVLQTIEGNTGTKNYNTSEVEVRKRPASCIYGIYRPKYPKKVKKVAKSYGEIRKYRCVAPVYVYKDHSIASGRTGKELNVGSIYSITAWNGDWVQIPFFDDKWVPVKGSQGRKSDGLYLERVPKIRYIVTNPTGANVYKSYSTKSTKLDNVICGSFLTITKWYGKWGFAPSVAGWVAMSCLSEECLGTRLFRDACINGRKLADAGTRYSADSPPRTLAGAIKAKKTDCAHYVSFALQDEGILSPGQYIWLDSEINGTRQGIKEITTSKQVKVIRGYGKTAKEAKLPIGAVAGYGYRYKGKDGKMHNGQHTQMCAGYTSAGNPLWMSGGVSDVNGKKYGPKRKTTYENRPISVLILPK